MTDEKQSKLEILIVEDREENMAAAKKYFGKLENVSADYAKDYTEAIANLESKKYGAVISDIFFPEKTGTEERQLGKKFIYVLAKEYLATENKPAAEALARFEKHVGIDKFPEFISSGDKYGTDYGTLTEMYKNLEKDASNQPLGFLVAEKAKEKGIPVILATSLDHHHASAKPALGYAGDRDISVCEDAYPDKKNSEAFWEYAFKIMKEKAK